MTTYLERVTSPLGDYIAAQRATQGINQTDLAARAGMGRAHLSEIERGKIALPGADLRRRLAHALGVSHLALLIAAGELVEDEVADAGKVGVVREDADSPAVRLAERVRGMRLTGRDAFVLEGMLDVLERRGEE